MLPEPTETLTANAGGKSDLQLAFDTLKAKALPYTTLWNYYDGDQPLVYTSERLREVFKFRESRFSENWCAVVIDAELERIHLNEFSVANQESNQQKINDIFEESELKLDAEDVHKAALVCGESYVFVWKNEDDETEAFYNDPRLCHVFYEPDNPRKKRFGAKWWVDESDGKRYLNLYYPDHIEYYATSQKAEATSTYRGLKKLQEDETNPFDEVPIFHFRIDRRKNTSRLDNVIDPQNALNKLLADMMVSAEFAAFPQRYIITGGDTGALKNSPNEIWTIPTGDGEGQNSSAGQFTAVDLANYLNAIDKLAMAIAVITRTPKHYMFAQGGDPSGEALIAMEAPLNKKAQKAIDQFSVVWKQVAAFIAKLNKIDIATNTITPTFDKPETVQPRTQAEIRQTNVNAGIPLKTTLRDEGWTEKELEQLEADKAESTNTAHVDAEGQAASDAVAADLWARIGIPSPTPAQQPVNGTVAA